MSKESAIFEGLNSEQRKAVASVDGPVLIVAGAGSGKTRVLTCRIANILEQGCDPSRILALTFTKKAAGEMKERIALMVGANRARRLYMGTFHSVFIRFLREYAQSLGYPESFTIYDTSDSVSAIKACIKELQLDDKIYKPKECLGRISMAKNNLVTHDRYRANPTVLANDAHSKRPRLCDIYTLYVQKCRQAGVMDFDDILLNMNILLRDNPKALEEISGRFSYLMVDEYQDTNYAQYLILKKLAGPHGNLCVVGDDSQSIYAFRGAKIENILNFKKDYPGCQLIRLVRNYRSTQTIVNAANSLIAKNEHRIPKECLSEGAEGEKIHMMRSFTEKEEAERVAGRIVEMMQTYKAQYQDFAILYRTNSQSRELEEKLRRRSIPYVIYSGNSFFERAEIKDMMAYFKLVVNPRDDESFKRVVNKPARGIGDTSLQALEALARAEQCCLMKALYSENALSTGLKAPALQKMRAFADMILSLSHKQAETDALEMSQKVADTSGLYAFFKSDTSIEGMSRTANIEELVNSVASFVEEKQNEGMEEMIAAGTPEEDAVPPVVTLSDFLENVTLLSNVDMEDEEDSANKVALMTVHSSKGLEFPYVFIVGLEENLFPSGGDLASPQDVEEERRLFYVAMTRAKKEVALSFASSRMRNGKTASNPPSRFIKDIDSQYLDKPLRPSDFDDDDEIGFGRFGSGNQDRRFGGGSSSPGNYGRSGEARTIPRTSRPAPSSTRPAALSARPAQVQSRPVATSRPLQPASRPAANPVVDANFIPSPMSDFRPGQIVEHNRFGRGRIIDITGVVPELKAIIAFDDYDDRKTILLKYAKMRIKNY